jgi:Siphovirus Gp157
MDTSLYVIEDTLQQLDELRDLAALEGDAEAVAVIDKQIAEYLDRRVAKVNSFAELAIKCTTNAAICKAKAQDFANRAGFWETKLANLKRIALEALQRFQVPKFETPEHTIRKQANGGLQELEVDEPVENLPAEFLRVRVDMSLRLWLSIMGDMSEVDCREVGKREMYADTEAIRKRLKTLEVCPDCAETGKVGVVKPVKCPTCEGKGLVPATIPGARLKPRGEHVRFV